MMTSITTLTYMSSLLSLKSLNPVKLSAIILLYSTLSFLMMYMTKGLSWFPAIFYMLFMGGILIMFMILSSGMPNESAMKSKTWELMFLATVSFVIVALNTSAGMDSVSVKMAFLNDRMITALTAAIILYFFYFLTVMSSKKEPLRESRLNCCYNGTL